MATTYATLAEFVASANTARINATSTAKHQQMLDAAAELVDRYTRGFRIGYEAFAVSASETRYYDDVISNNGVVDIDDAVSVTALTRGGVTIASTDYYTYPYNPGEGPITQIRLLSSALVSNPVYQMLGRSYNFPFKNVGIKAIAVTGTWGYASSVPKGIKEATLTLAVRMYELSNLGKDNMVNLALAGGDVASLDRSVLMILNKYRGARFG